jgi:type VI protein secretion system component VasF
MESVPLKSPYQTSAGKPWMRKSWVVYLDILGFSARVAKATADGTANQLLSDLTNALNEAKVDLVIDYEEYTAHGIKEAPYAVKMFTDNVVLGFPIRDDGESEFGRMIYILGFWQYTLLRHGFFVRGGVTVGPIYMDDDMVFGKGLLDAYEAETKLARDPRVVLAQSAMDLVHHHLAYYAKVSEAPHNTALLVDADGQMFVNYLYLPVDGVEGLPEAFIQDIKRHRDLIVERLQEFSGEPSIWSKYAWVGSYHNHFCSHYQGLDHLKVPPARLATAPKFLSQVYKRKGDRMFRGDTEVAKLKYLSQWKTEKEPE